MNLHGHSLLKETDFTAAEFGYLIDLGAQLHTIKAVMVATAGLRPGRR